MTLHSSAFNEHQSIPPQYTCDGENKNPPLSISEIPHGTVELVLIVDDPDAPTNEPWLHWIVWHIDPNTREIETGKLPSGAVEGKNSGGQAGYQGPCPPDGTHRYRFTLYALDMTLTLPIDATRTQVEQAMAGHVLQVERLTGVYART